MEALPYRSLIHTEVFKVLGTLFSDHMTATNLLEDIGAEPAELPSFGHSTPEAYWRSVGRELSRGKFPDIGLHTLLEGALTLYPGHALLRDQVLSAGYAAPGSVRTAQLRVLCLQASPSDRAAMRLDVEHREMRQAIRGSARPLHLIVHPATRSRDIVAQITQARPDIVHFAGHGSVDGELEFETETGRAAPLPVETLATMLAASGRVLEAVLLTSCHLGGHLEKLMTTARAVIGCTHRLHDPYAIAFSRDFYTALAAGQTVATAFTAGCGAIGSLGGDPAQMTIRTSGAQA